MSRAAKACLVALLIFANPLNGFFSPDDCPCWRVIGRTRGLPVQRLGERRRRESRGRRAVVHCEPGAGRRHFAAQLSADPGEDRERPVASVPSADVTRLSLFVDRRARRSRARRPRIPAARRGSAKRSAKEPNASGSKSAKGSGIANGNGCGSASRSAKENGNEREQLERARASAKKRSLWIPDRLPGRRYLSDSSVSDCELILKETSEVDADQVVPDPPPPSRPLPLPPKEDRKQATPPVSAHHRSSHQQPPQQPPRNSQLFKQAQARKPEVSFYIVHLMAQSARVNSVFLFLLKTRPLIIMSLLVCFLFARLSGSSNFAL